MPRPFDWQPLSPFGARVDLDLSGDVSEDAIAELRDLYARHHLLVFSHQHLSHDAQVKVSGWFGPVVIDAVPTYISTDPDVGGLGNSRLPFHSDLMCSPHPFLGLSLHAVDVTDGATSTLFAHAMHAAAALPGPLRARIKNLHAMHLWPVAYSERPRSADVPKDWPGTIHPLLLPHPRSGADILCLNANHTDRIIELESGESEQMIQELFGYLYDEGNSYEHRWRKGDFIMWDNLAVQHGRPPIPDGMPRTLQKVMLGTHTTRELLPPQVMAAYAVELS